MIDNIIESRTLFELADNLQDFLSNIGDSTVARHHISKLKKAVYEVASQFALGQYLSFIREPFIMFDGRLSVIEYLSRQWPDKQSFRFECQLLKSITTNIKSHIIEPEGNIITEGAVKRLVKIVNEQIDFSHLVLNEQKLFIFSFSNTHQKWNSECITHNPDTEQAYCDLFLYHMRNECKCTPEFVFMHELGHTFQVRLTRSLLKVPESFYSFAEYLIPQIRAYDSVIVREIFADFFAMGLLTDSQYQKYDTYPIPAAYKMLMKTYIMALAGSLQ